MHRGYEAEDPATGEPLCLDRDAVHAALEAPVKVQLAACASADGRRCPVL